MAWRELVVESACKISCSNNYLIVRSENVQKIHLSEISYLIIANPSINITGVALCELAKYKVKVVFCDEKHNPYGEMINYYGCHNSSKKLQMQLDWKDNIRSLVNTEIIYRKIANQMTLLQKLGFLERAGMVQGFLDGLELDDVTNREGHSAKVYFNTLFGNEFNRNLASNINSALNYGYSILLSAINREVVANGCLTQLGVNHCNEFNQFNFSCDIIEPFRVVIDEYVYNNAARQFDKEYKYDLVNLLNKNVTLDCNMTLLNTISVSVKSIIDSLNNQDLTGLKLYKFQ